MPDWQQFLSLAIQLPLVGIFVLFVLEMLKRESIERDRRDQQWQIFLEKQNNDWREFLREERAWRSASLSEVASDLKSIGIVSMETNSILKTHDAWERVMNERLLEKHEGGSNRPRDH